MEEIEAPSKSDDSTRTQYICNRVINISLVFVNGFCQSTAFQTNNLLCTTGELEIKTTRGEERYAYHLQEASLVVRGGRHAQTRVLPSDSSVEL